MPKRKKRMIDALNYYGEDVENNLLSLLAIVQGKKIIGEVDVKNGTSLKHSYKSNVFDNYGDQYKYLESGVEFDDGTVLIAVTVSTWGGTFASHHAISIKYYLLTPR